MDENQLLQNAPGRSGSSGARTRFVVLAGTLLALLAGVVAMLGEDAGAAPNVTLDVEVAGVGTGGVDAVDVSNLTFADAVAAIDQPARTSITLPVAPALLPPLSLEDAGGWIDPSLRSMAFRGSADVLGIRSEVLVTAIWDDDADTSATTAVVFDLGASRLDQLVAGVENIALNQTLLGVTTTPHTLTAAQLPNGARDIVADSAVRADGSELPDEFVLVDSGISFRALVGGNDPVLAGVAADLGLDSTVRLEGRLSADIDLLAFLPVPPEPTATTVAPAVTTVPTTTTTTIAPTGPTTTASTAPTTTSTTTTMAPPTTTTTVTPPTTTVPPTSTFAALPPTNLFLQASIPAAAPGALPSHLAPSGVWTLALEAQTGPTPSVSIDFSGSLDIAIGSTTIPTTMSAAVAATPTEISVDLGLGVGPVDDLLGQPWLDLESLALDASITRPRTPGLGGTFSGSLSASLDLEDLTGQDATAAVAFGFETGTSGLAGTIDVSTSGLTVGVGQLATGLGDGADVLGVGVSLSDFAISVRFDLAATTPGSVPTTTTPAQPGVPTTTQPGGSSNATSKVTVAVTSTASLDINGSSLSGTALLRVETTSQVGLTPKVVFALRSENPPMLSDLLGSGVTLPVDFQFPSVTLSVATAGVTIAAVDLDPATAQFTGGEALDLPSGIGLTAGVDLPSNLKDVLGEIGVDVNGPLVIQGQIPIFGGTETSLRIELPEFASDGVFRSGTLAFELSSTTIGQFSAKLVGTATVAVPRSNDPACDPETTDYTQNENCLDLLTFELASEFSTSPTTGLTVTIAAGLTAESGDGTTGWKDPTGIVGITVYELRLEASVSVGVGPSAAPTFTIGFLGRLSIEGIPDLAADQGGRTPIDLTVSFALSASPRFPFIEPVGFTFASGRGFGFNDMITVAEVISQTDLPDDGLLPTDLRLENVFVSVSSRTIESLCLRQGIFISGELHLGGTPVAGDPQCLPPAPPLNDPDAPPPATQRCIQSDSCLAAVLLDVNPSPTNGGPRLAAQGVLNTVDLGPLQLDPTVLSLELSPSTQRLFASGGVTLADPFDPASGPWAQGSVTVDFSPTQLIARGSASILGDADNPQNSGLSIRFNATAILSLTDPQFVLDVEFDQNLLEAIGNEISPEVGAVLAQIDGFLQVDIRQATWFQNLKDELERTGDTPQWLLDVIQVAADVENGANQVNEFFVDLKLPPPFPLLTIRDLILNGVDISSTGIPALEFASRDLGVDGCANLQGRYTDGKCYILDPFSFEIPGVCAIAGFDEGSTATFHALLCGPNANAEQLVDEVYGSEALPRTVGALPDGLTATELLRDEGPSIAGAALEVLCGKQRIDYGAGTVTDPVVTLGVGGQTVAADLGVDPFALDSLDDVVPDDSAGLTEILDDLADDNGPLAPACSSSLVPGSGDLIFFDVFEDKFSNNALAVDEGAEFVALVECAKADTATVAWGDGTVTTVDMNGGNDSGDDDPIVTERVRHTYADDTGAGAPFRPTIDCGGLLSQSSEIFVANVEPRIGDLRVVSDDSDSVELVTGAPATVEVRVIEPSGDTVTLDLLLGAEEFSFVLPPAPNGADRVVSFPWTVIDSGDVWGRGTELVAIAEVDDGDGGTDRDSETFVVENASPSFVSLTPIVVQSGAAPGAALVPAKGQSIVYELTVSDPNVGDNVRVDLDWGDGSAVEVVNIEPTGAVERTVSVAHTYSTIGPKTVTLTLDDRLSDRVTAQVVFDVVGIAPSIDLMRAQTGNRAGVEVGVPFTLGFDVNDPDNGFAPISYEIDWGDGSAVFTNPQRSPFPEGVYFDNIGHTYATPGPKTITLTVTDRDGAVASRTLVVNVEDTRPSGLVVTLPDEGVFENELFTMDVTFTSSSPSGSLTTVSVDWGNGERTVSDSYPFEGQSLTVQIANILPDDAVLDALVTVTDGFGRSTSVTQRIVVQNQVPRIRNFLRYDTPTDQNGATVNPAGQPLTFLWNTYDPGVLDDVTLSIDWGDETSDELVISTLVFEPGKLSRRSLNGRQGLLSHTYAEPGAYQVGATIVDDDGASGVPWQFDLVVTAPGPENVVVSPTSSSVDEGGAASVDVSFDAEPDTEPHRAFVRWGDGSSETILVATGERSVSAAHVYADEGQYPVTVTMLDVNDAAGLGATSITVQNVAPTVDLSSSGAASPVDIDVPVSFDVSTSDAGVLDDTLVTIDWGDGTSEDVSVPAGDPNTAVTSVAHSYSTPGSYDVTATAQDGDGGSAVSPAVTVTAIDPRPRNAAVLPTSATIDEGGSTTLDVSFVDDSVDDAHTVSIDWGDGSSESVTVAGDERAASADHTYADNGDYTVSVTITDDAGNATSESATVSVSNVAPAVAVATAEAGPFEPDVPVSFDVSTSDVGVLDDIVVTIDWGDGTSQDVSVPAGDPNAAVTSVVHTYAELGSYDVTATADDGDGGSSELFTLSVTVIDPRPRDVAVTADPGSIDEGGSTTLDVSFVDRSATDAHTVSIDWGDGSSESIELVNGERTVSADHTYADDGDYTVSVTIADAAGNAASESTVVSVSNVAPTVGLGSTTVMPVDFGAPVSFDIATSDVGVLDDIVVTIDWGDGTSQDVTVLAGDPNSAMTSVTHAYVEPGSYDVIATADDGDGGSTVSTSVSVSVIDPRPRDVAVTADPGSIDEGGSTTLDVSFVDDSVDDAHTVSIDWGDGSSESVAVADGERAASADHTYADDGDYTVSVTITDAAGNAASESTVVSVSNVAPTIESFTVTPVSASENGSDVTASVVFSDPSILDSHSVVIDWGEGWADATGGGDLRNDDVRFSELAVDASAERTATALNRFGDDGEFTVAVTITDEDGASVTQQVAITVANEAPEFDLTIIGGTVSTPGGDTVLIAGGEPVTVDVSVDDAGSDDVTVDVDFGDGSAVDSTTILNGGAPDGELSAQVAPVVDAGTSTTSQYARACLQQLAVTVTDDDGAASVETISVVSTRVRDAFERWPSSAVGWWLEIRRGNVEADRLSCLLDGAGHLSSVLLGASEFDGTTEANGIVDITELRADGAPAVLRPWVAGSTYLERLEARFDRQLLTTWLNVMDGVISLDDVTRTGRTYREMIEDAEAMRLDGASAWELRLHTWRLGRLR